MIEIRPHTGLRRGTLVDTGIDAVWVVEPNRPSTRIGFVGRQDSAPLQLTELGVSPAVIAEAKRKLAERDGVDQTITRLVTEPPQGLQNDPDDEEECDE